MRKDDLIIRYGGEEFLIFINTSSCKDALNIAEKIRKHIEKARLQVEKYSINFTISLGISKIFKDKPLYFSIEKADQALYQAKRKGRNRVELAQEELA